MKRRLFLILAVCFLAMSLSAQSNRKIKELEARRKELHQQIAESETLLQSTRKDVKSQLDNLALLTGQIEERRRYLHTIESDVNALTLEIASLRRQWDKLRRELAEKKKRYEASVVYMYRNKSIQEKLIFIFSADNLSRMYRRLRYVRQYADYQRIQADEVERKQRQVVAKRQELEQAKTAKESLLHQAEAEKQKLETQEKERHTLLAGLQKKQKGIQGEINKKKQTARQLNDQIDRLIEIEIEQARKRAEEEARRRKAAVEAARRAEEARRKSASDRKTETAVAPPSASSSSSRSSAIETSPDAEERQLSTVFERNRGILPMPVSGPCVVVGHYGQYAVDGLRNVKLENKGIDIQGKPGAQARAIFDGEVTTIFQYNGMTNVLVRHGAYISVYCNLSSVSVSKGTRVKTRTPLGTIRVDERGNAVLHFQLRKETSKLNPELWLAR